MIEARRDPIPDFTIEQNWQEYSEEEHAIWRLLFERQQRLLAERACREYLDGLHGLGVAFAMNDQRAHELLGALVGGLLTVRWGERAVAA